MSKLETNLDKLESLVGQAETQLRSLRAENGRLRAAIDTAPPPADPAARSGRPLRQIVLESERQEIRTRIKNLLEAL